MVTSSSKYGQSFVILLVVSVACSVIQSSRLSFRQDKNNRNTTKIVCYFALAHHNYNATLPPALNSTLCTHVIFINSIITDCRIQAVTQDDINFFNHAIPILKKQNPALKVLLSNGGGAFHSFDDTLLSAVNRQRYIDSAVTFLRNNGFDGLDLDWEFPGWDGKPVGQRKNFTMLVRGMRAAFEKEAVKTQRERLLLTAAVSAVQELMVIYDIKELGQDLDLVNMMGYDYHGPNPKSLSYTGFNSPVYPAAHGKDYITRNLNWSSHAWVNEGMPKEKLMVGVPVYCKAYTLLVPDILHGHGAPAYKQGDCESQAYVCPCTAIKKYGAKSVFDVKAQVPYLYYKDQWVSYEDEQSMTIKAKFVMDNGYGGIMIFSLSSDDYLGVCDGVTRFPLTAAVHRAIYGH